MNLFNQPQTREEYFQTQIERSQLKFSYCKVSFSDVSNYRKIIGVKGAYPHPIICMGTRNGKEVDLFRIVFERKLFRKNSATCGVEINPWAKRDDIFIGSFDELPKQFEQKFGLIFSNSFDQSQDPERTAKEWKRVALPGALLIVCYSEHTPPTQSDPVGNLSLDDMMRLFGNNVIYHKKNGSTVGYTETMIRLA